MSDFASSALYNLAVLQLRARGFESDSLKGFSGKMEAGAKRELLNDALEALGPEAIISIGQGVRSVPYEPTLEVLKRAATARDLLERWMRLESYYHGKNRTRIKDAGVDFVKMTHYAQSGPAPSPGEDLLIAGLLAALLQLAGCRGLTLSIVGLSGSVIANDQVNTVVWDLKTKLSDWHFTWTEFTRQTTEGTEFTEKDSIAERVNRVIGDDPGRGWKIDQAASELALSTRSLQRRLSDSGTTFQKVLRRARTDQAAQKILENQMSLAVIGYACGFSDQAHFNREFKSRFNMTPQAYAKLEDES